MKCLVLSLLAITIALPAFAYKVQTDYDHSVNFEQFHTYCWGRVKTSDPFYVDRIREAVNRNLQAKGWQLVTSHCDATVFAADNVRNQKQVETFYSGNGGGWGWRGFGGGTATTTAYDEKIGHVVLDIFATKNKHLLWRSMTERDLSTNSDKNTKELNSDIDKMLKNFPPKGSPTSGE
jgi:hypothetical protein